MKAYIKDLLTQINSKTTQHKLNSIKSKLAKKYKLKKIPTNIELIQYLTSKQKEKYKNTIRTKPVRTISGVAPLAIMTSPAKCPHGKCTYCPGGPKSTFGTTPQSYTGKEPATMRAIRNNYDPYLQVFNRLEQYTLLNQTIEKIELIIMGGTFPARTITYQDNFIKFALKALNDFSDIFYKNNRFNLEKFKTFFELPGDKYDKERTKSLQAKILKIKGKSNLKKEQLKNETSKIRCVALCQESRPDFAKEKHINQMLKLGTTRVELGVQHLNNKILKNIKRGHTIKETVKATQLLKDSFLKVGYHMMPGLPGSSPKKDLKMLKELFKNPDYRPDALKIYPCMVTKGTQLYNLWKKRKYKPLTTEKAAKLITEFKKFIPTYVRVLRVQRDIPTNQTIAGVDMTNLRQLMHQKYKPNCRCIRCREPKNKKIDWKKVKILKKDYKSSQGTEIFLSVEDTKNDLLLGFCRLRIPYKPFRKEITKKPAGIRELHVYGISTGLGKKGDIQHKGLGIKLMLEAERIAKEEYDIKKLIVISGMGVREYYQVKMGYKKDGPYMVKKL